MAAGEANGEAQRTSPPAPGAGPRPAHGARWNLVGAASDIGRVRKVDEDSVLVAEVATAFRGAARKRALLVIADGVGGHAKGDVASAIAARAVAGAVFPLMLEGRPVEEAEWGTALKAAFAAANREVLQAASGDTDGMATTLAVALMDGERAAVAWLGDSRVYRVRGPTAERLSKDHSLVQMLVDAGEISQAEARIHPKRNVVTKVVGAEAEPQADIRFVRLEGSDTLVVCCDGLPAHVEDAEIAAHVEAHVDGQEAADALVALANARGGSDNISVIVAPATVTWL